MCHSKLVGEMFLIHIWVSVCCARLNRALSYIRHININTGHRTQRHFSFCLFNLYNNACLCLVGRITCTASHQVKTLRERFGNDTLASQFTRDNINLSNRLSIFSRTYLKHIEVFLLLKLSGQTNTALIWQRDPSIVNCWLGKQDQISTY